MMYKYTNLVMLEHTCGFKSEFNGIVEFLSSQLMSRFSVISMKTVHVILLCSTTREYHAAILKHATAALIGFLDVERHIGVADVDSIYVLSSVLNILKNLSGKYINHLNMFFLNNLVTDTINIDYDQSTKTTLFI